MKKKQLKENALITLKSKQKTAKLENWCWVHFWFCLKGIF